MGSKYHWPVFGCNNGGVHYIESETDSKEENNTFSTKHNIYVTRTPGPLPAKDEINVPIALSAFSFRDKSLPCVETFISLIF